MSKLVWKPLDLMGKRLYRVVATFRGSQHRSHHIVAADAPRHAAQVYLRSIGQARVEMDATGFALKVGQPAEWFEQEPSADHWKCKHGRSDFLESSDGPTFRHHVTICQDCGQIRVFVCKEGKCSIVEFGLHCDQHLRAAAKYLRSPLQEADALRRAAGTLPEETP